MSELSPQPNPGAEQELLRRVAQGDVEAFSSFYDCFNRALYSVALNILRDVPAAEDVLQEAMVQVWERAPQYDPSLGKPLTWAMALTRNKAIDRLRSLQRRYRILERATDEQDDNHHVVNTAGGLELMSRESATIVRKALAGLPLDQRHAIELSFSGGLSHGEVAEELSLPLGTVKARIRRGMLTLREQLVGIL